MIRHLNTHLAAKVFAATFALVLAVGAILYAVAAAGMSATYLSQVESSLDAQMTTLVAQLSDMDETETDRALDEFALTHGVALTLDDADGTVLRSYGELGVQPVPGATSDDLAAADGIMQRYPVTLADGQSVTVSLFADKQQINVPLRALHRVMPALLGVALALAVLAALLFSRMIARPVVALSATSRRLAALRLDERAPQRRTDEIGRLGADLNTMAARLEETMTSLQRRSAQLEAQVARERRIEEHQRTMFATLSHDLKTPIAVLGGQIDGMLLGVGDYRDHDRHLRRARAIVEGLRGRVQEILELSRLTDEGFAVRREAVRVDRLVAAQVADIEDLATDRGLAVRVAADTPVTLDADPRLIALAAGNLLANALDYTSANGTIEVAVDPGALRIANSVDHRLDEERLRRLRDPFALAARTAPADNDAAHDAACEAGNVVTDRADAAPRSGEPCATDRDGGEAPNRIGGAGLGLAVVGLICERHGYAFDLTCDDDTFTAVIRFDGE